MTLNDLGKESASDHGINWVTATFMMLFHVGAVAALFFFSWKLLFLAVFLYWVSGSLGIGMAYHRLLTHRGYKTPKWVEYFLTICATLALEGGPILEEPLTEKAEAGMVKKPPIPLKDIVKAKYVVCLECGKKLKTLKTHLRTAHGLMPKEYFQKFGLDPKKFPLICKDYSEARSKMAKERGLGALGRKKKMGG